MIAFIVWVVVFAAAAAAGAWLGTRSNRVAAISAAVCTALVTLRVALRFFPDIEDRFIPFEWYLEVHPWWIFPPGLAIVSLGAMKMSTRGARIGVGAFAALLFVLATLNLYRTEFTPPATFEGRPDRQGHVRQTTDFSCGAAAAATMATQLGVGTDERVMADLCHTNAFLGTDAIGVAHGLRKRLGPGWDIAIRRMTSSELAEVTLPAAVVVKFGLWVDHWVVVLKVEGDRFTVSDPAGRIHEWSRERLEQRWRGIVVTAHKRAAPGR